MVTKAQHAGPYRYVTRLLRELRENASLTQRDLGAAMGKPQSWVHNCETGNRRVDVTEFIAWCEACGIKPEHGFQRILGRMK